MRILGTGSLALLLTLSFGVPGQADWLLDTPNSEVDVRWLNLADDNDPRGITSWKVDGTEHASEGWFWYRSGDDTKESHIEELNIGTPSGSDDYFSVVFSDPDTDFNVTVEYLLTGGTVGSGKSSLASTVTVANTSGEILPFDLFAYYDFDLYGDPDDDSVTWTGPDTVTQTHATGEAILTTVSATVPSAWQAEGWHTPPSVPLRIQLNDDALTELTNSSSTFGPDDVIHAFQYSVDIPIGGSFSVDITHTVVPAPSTLAGLIGVALTGLILRRRRRR